MFRTSPVHLQERFVQAVFADLVCAAICVLLDTSRRYKVVGRSSFSLGTYQLYLGHINTVMFSGIM